MTFKNYYPFIVTIFVYRNAIKFNTLIFYTQMRFKYHKTIITLCNPIRQFRHSYFNAESLVAVKEEVVLSMLWNWFEDCLNCFCALEISLEIGWRCQSKINTRKTNCEMFLVGFGNSRLLRALHSLEIQTI